MALCTFAQIAITPTTIANGYVQSPYVQTLNVSGGTKPYTWTVLAGTLPTGVLFSASNSNAAQLSGTPTTAGTYSFTIKATDVRTNTVSVTYTVTITQVVLTATQMTDMWNRGTPDYFGLWNTWNSLSGTYANGWSVTGNTGLTAGTNFIGTNDATDVVIKRNATEVMRFYSSSNFLGIGTAAPTQFVQISKSQNDTTMLNVENTSIAANAFSGIRLGTDGGKTFISRSGSGYAVPNTLFINEANAYRISANGNIGITQLSNGRVGLLTATPGNNIDLSGNTSVTGFLGINTYTTTADIDVRGSSYSVTVSASAYTSGATSHSLKAKDSNGAIDFSVRGDGQIATTYSVSASAGDAATLNAASGYFTKDASGTTFTLTNSLITAASIVMVEIGTVGLTAGNNVVAVSGSGSATITFQSAAGAAEAPNANAIVKFWIVN